jgi:Pectate lyase superfamily protein
MSNKLAIVLLCIVDIACGTVAEAVCTGTSVRAFGAKGDGSSDDTAAIQSAINATAGSGGGSVVFNVARYFTGGNLIVPAGVVLCGAVEGPFDDGSGVNPGVTTIAPTLLVTNSSAPFITLNGLGAGVTDLLFHYPNQVHNSASSPNVYPYTIVAKAPGTKVVRSMTSNAYNFLDIESGRVIAQDLFIGAYNIGINIDHANDHVTLRNVMHSVFWDSWEPPPSYPSTIDGWVMSHGIALMVNRIDSLEVHDFVLFHRYAGIIVADSPDGTQSPRCGYGTGSDINLDTVQYGIIVSAAQVPGFVFTNVIIGSGAGGQAAVQVKAGGSLSPDVLVEGGSIRGFWALRPLPAPGAGNLTVANIIGFDLP